MKTEIADNQLFLKNMSFIKVSFVTILTTLFSFSVNAQTEKEHDLATNPTGIGQIMVKKETIIQRMKKNMRNLQNLTQEK